MVLRLPFRFGVVTLTQCPQAFARARIEFAEGGKSQWGAAAEMMAPKWFDKNLQLSNEDNFEQLRDVLLLAREAYLSDARPRRPSAISPGTTTATSRRHPRRATTRCWRATARR